MGVGSRMLAARVAAWRAGVPVIASALNASEWQASRRPLDLLLWPITDAFIELPSLNGHSEAAGRLATKKMHVIVAGDSSEEGSAPSYQELIESIYLRKCPSDSGAFPLARDA